ncbi:MAG: hypothetical protein ABIK28_03045 [Planctomycetota bacterium]
MARKTLFVLFLLCLGMVAYANDLNVRLEEQGMLDSPAIPFQSMQHHPMNQRPSEFLMIPDSTSDTVGMYDPYDGTYLGVLIDGAGLFSTPINAVLGPDGNIYVSDQIKDSVYVFDMDGTYLSTYADGTDGLNNIRGIDFRDGHLFVTSGDDYVAEFDGPHSRLPDFISGVDSFDVLFLADGSCLVIDIGLDVIKYYDSNGVFQYDVIAIDFGEQVVFDLLTPGEFLSSAFSEKIVKDFELSGTLVESTVLNDYGRGIFRLGNGNLLSAQYDGVYEVQPGTGVYLGQKFAGSMRFVELVGEMTPPSLTVDPKQVSSWDGGTVEFALTGGVDLADKSYALFGTFSGVSPGTALPGGLILPINWDWFTDLLLNFALLGGYGVVNDFIGTLDQDGNATATLVFPGHCQQYEDIVANFAWCTYDPFEFVSNAVGLTITGVPPTPDGYQYDDGTAENALGLTAGGQMCWLQWFEVFVGGETIDAISTAWSYPGGSYPPAGTAAYVYLWDDPNNDGNPTDAVLLASAATTVQDPGTNIFTLVPITPTTVSGRFFIGASCDQAAGQYPGPMDESTSPYGGQAWVVGDTTYNFDATNLNNNDVAPVELGSIGFPAYWLLRASVVE